MWQALKPFTEPTQKSLSLQSKAWVELGVLKVAFELRGELKSLLLPEPEKYPARVIGLWQSTCFEMFVKNTEKEEYFEFNCSSANNWNVFHFPNKKAALKEYLPMANLASSTVQNEKLFSLIFWVDVAKFSEGFWQEGKMSIGLASVLETKKSELSYWALNHLDDKPNFHQQDAFIFFL